MRTWIVSEIRFLLLLVELFLTSLRFGDLRLVILFLIFLVLFSFVISFFFFFFSLLLVMLVYSVLFMYRAAFCIYIILTYQISMNGLLVLFFVLIKVFCYKSSANF